MIEIISAALLIMAASLAGAITLWKGAGKFIEKNISFLVSFSAGVFLIVTYQLAAETIEIFGSPGKGVFWILLGAVVLYIFFKLLPDFHHHHDEEKEKGHTHKSIDVRRILISDSIHNIGDGVLLAASFAVDTRLGFIAAISVFTHEFLQEVSEFFVLRQSGKSTKRALLLNFLVSGTILIGAIGGFFILDLFEALEGPLLGIAAGSFFIVVIHDLIPHSVRASRNNKDRMTHIVWFFIGAVLMTGLQAGTEMIFGESHSHGDAEIHEVHEDDEHGEIH